MSQRKKRTRIGHIGYAQIIASLPGTVEDIAAKVDRRHDEVARIMREMMALRIVHRPRFVRRGRNNSPAGWWEIGDGKNARCAHTPERIQPRPKLIAFASIVRAMESPASIAEIANATGVDRWWIGKLLRAMHGFGIARIAGWSRSSTTMVAEYAMGSGTDAPRPRVKTRSAVNEDYARRKSALREQARIGRALAGTSYEDVVEAIRAAPASAPATWLADRYGVHHSTVRRIRDRITEAA